MSAPWCGRTPRKWQAEALPLVLASLRRKVRTVVSATPGAGKSILMAEVIAVAITGGQVVVTVPSVALVKQLSATLRARLGDDAVGEFYGQRKQHDRKVVVCCQPSAMTLAPLLERPPVMLCCDEVHRTEVAAMHEFAAAVKPVTALGFSGTPFRSNAKERLQLWDECAYRYSFVDAVADGVLVPIRPVHYHGKGTDEVNEVCLSMIREHGNGPGVVSAVNIDDAEFYAGMLRDEGISAEAIHSRLGRDEQAARLARLLAGELRCVVHVSMLAEGIDIPELRWICLRRPVGSKVRFIQEVMRPLRAHPGKTEAVVLDPYNLLGVHGMDTAEALGAAMDGTDEPEARDEYEPAEPLPVELPPAVCVARVDEYTERLLAALVEAGVREPPRVYPERWRNEPPEFAQMKRLASYANPKSISKMPAPHRRAWLAIYEGDFDKHTAARLLDIAGGWSQWRKRRAFELMAKGVAKGAAWGRAAKEQCRCEWVPVPTAAEIRGARGGIG